MTEDFAADMYLLRDLLLLAQNNGHRDAPAWSELNIALARLEKKASELMVAVQDLKLAFNPDNRDLMMGMWIASFVDPVDPPNGEKPAIDTKLGEAELVSRAKRTGTLLNELLDDLKYPHKKTDDKEPQGDQLRAKITSVSTLVADDLNGPFLQLGKNLDRMLAAFQRTGGGGGESTYWPSNYVSSSSSSSSSSGYP